MHQFVQLRIIVADRAPVDFDRYLLFNRVDIFNITHVAIEHIFVVIVAHLHHPVPRSVDAVAIAAFDPVRPRRIESLLDHPVK